MTRDGRYLAIAIGIAAATMAVVALSACTTPEQRCPYYTGAAARYERILEEGSTLTTAQRAAYDAALAGQAATCAPHGDSVN